MFTDISGPNGISVLVVLAAVAVVVLFVIVRTIGSKNRHPVVPGPALWDN